jgi:hypothetical protein
MPNFFMASQYHHAGAQEGTNYSRTMKRLQTSAPVEEVLCAFSASQSVSSMSHNSPATPHTNYDMDCDGQKNLYSGTDEDTLLLMDDSLLVHAGYQAQPSANVRIVIGQEYRSRDCGRFQPSAQVPSSADNTHLILLIYLL